KKQHCFFIIIVKYNDNSHLPHNQSKESNNFRNETEKTHIISLILFSGLLFTKPVLAEDTISSDNTPMGHYIQNQETSKDSSSDTSSTTPNIRARLF
ncbi:hypothetical protein ACIKN0_11075, partial [Pediococcus acidilactici]